MSPELPAVPLLVCPNAGDIIANPYTLAAGDKPAAATNGGPTNPPRLCGLCAAATVPPTHQWAPLLCANCHQHAVAHNATAGYPAIPTARHTLTPNTAADTATVENALGGLRAGLEALNEWRTSLVRHRLPHSEQPVPLESYLADARVGLKLEALLSGFLSKRADMPVPR